MTKKCLVIIFLVFILFCAGCKPDGLSSEMYTLGKKALAIADQYLDFEMTASSASELLDDIYDRFDDFETLGADGLILQIKIGSVKWDIRGVEFDTASYEDVIEQRNELAELLNKSKR